MSYSEYSKIDGHRRFFRCAHDILLAPTRREWVRACRGAGERMRLIGAVVVDERGVIIVWRAILRAEHDPSAHAEVNAIRPSQWRLT